MGESKRNIAVGLTAMAGLAGLLALLLLFGYVPGWLQKGYPVCVDLPNAAGLHEGSRVRLNGIDVGEVEAVRFASEAKMSVRVRVLIHGGVKIPRTVSATVYRSLFGGSPSVELYLKQPGPPGQYLPAHGKPAVITGESGSITAALGKQVRDSLKVPIEHFNQLSEHLEKLSAQWTLVGQNMNMLVQPRSTGAVDAGKATGNLATVLARMDKRLAQLKPVIANVQKLTGDKQFRDNLRVTVANARQISTKINKDIDSLTSTVKTNVSTLGKRYTMLADHLSKAVDSMQKLADQARQGKGTVGKLLQDPSLYNNLNDTVHQLQSAIDQAKLLLQKWKAEGVPVQF